MIYAQAVFETAKASFSQKEWALSLKSLSDVVQDDEMRHILRDPRISRLDLKELLLPLLDKASASKEETAFVTTLIDNGHLSLAPNILRDFVRLQRLDQGFRNVSITSAAALDAGQILRLENYLTERFNIHVENIVITVDTSLVAGVIIRMEDRVIDQSQGGKQRPRPGK